jgi:uncharacterized membrane protein YccC
LLHQVIPISLRYSKAMDIALSMRFKESVKTALAMVISYAIALQMGWDRPYWAGFAVAFISLSTVGQSLNKGALRMAGTVLGVLAALTLLSLFPQQRWLFITFLSLWVALCTYMMGGERYSYFWFVGGFVSALVAASGGPDPENAFSIAMLRAQQTGLGILVYGVISALIWPNNSGPSFVAITGQLLQNQGKLLRASIDALQNKDERAAAQACADQHAKLQTQFQQLLAAALTDTDEVRETTSAWQRYAALQAQLSIVMQRWRDSFAELDDLPIEALLPGLQSYKDGLGRRLDKLEKLHSGTDIDDTPTAPEISVSSVATAKLSHFHKAALVVAVSNLQQMDHISRAMLDCMEQIRDSEKIRPTATDKAREGFSGPVLDTDRFSAAARVAVTLWLAFIAIIYIPGLPGGMGLMGMVTPIVMILASSPQLPVSVLFYPVALGLVLSSALYIFVMPQLSSFAGLGTMIFLCSLLICYHYWEPAQGLCRAIVLALFFTVIGVSNQQNYSILSVTTTALMFSTLFVLAAITAYIPLSSRPTDAFRRLLRRYFTSAGTMLSAAPLPAWKTAFHAHELKTLPGKLAAWSGHINPARLDSGGPAQLQALVSSLQALSLRIQELRSVGTLPQSQTAFTAIASDLEAWVARAEKLCQRLADDPSAASATDSSAVLTGILQQLESCIEHVMDQDKEQPMDETEGVNFYQLLGAYRGMSAALLKAESQAGAIDWPRWSEERFS